MIEFRLPLRIQGQRRNAMVPRPVSTTDILLAKHQTVKYIESPKMGAFDRVGVSRRKSSDGKPVWIESERDQTSVARRATLKVHSARLLQALWWFLIFLIFIL